MSPSASLPLFDRLQAAAERIEAAIGSGRRPRTVLVLGSGLGAFADRRVHAATILDYAAIPHFPSVGVGGHRGRLVLGEIEGVSTAVLQGRAHYYEGHALAEVTLPLRSLLVLGASMVLVTNAAGGIREDLRPGSLMVIEDHLNLFGADPLRGVNDRRLGPRFPDLTEAYDGGLRRLAKTAAEAAGVPLQAGVYAGRSGPAYETPAEIEMLRRLGADAVGMSTVPEAIVANHMGARVLGLSCITNLAAGRSAQKLSHDEVEATAARSEEAFSRLLTEIFRRL